MADGAFSPWKYLADVLRAQLRLEANLPPEDRTRTMWSAMVEFAGTSALVGRGGANTCFYKFGNRDRKVDYPNKLMRLLQKLAAQDYPLYRISDGERTLRSSFGKKSLDGAELRVGWRLMGVSASGEETLLAKARKSVRGNVAWIKVK